MVPTDASRVIAAHGHPVEAGTIVLLVVLFVVVAGGIIALGWRSQAKPSPEIETPSPTSGVNTVPTGLTVTREHLEVSPPADRRALLIRLDGAEIGRLKPGQSVSVPVDPGDHVLSTKLSMNFIGSRPIAFHARNGELVFVKLEHRLLARSGVLLIHPKDYIVATVANDASSGE
jgi:hypothetical protein